MMIRLLLSGWITNFLGVYCSGKATWLKTAPSFSNAKILRGEKAGNQQITHSGFKNSYRNGLWLVTQIHRSLKALMLAYSSLWRETLNQVFYKYLNDEIKCLSIKSCHSARKKKKKFHIKKTKPKPPILQFWFFWSNPHNDLSYKGTLPRQADSK